MCRLQVSHPVRVSLQRRLPRNFLVLLLILLPTLGYPAPVGAQSYDVCPSGCAFNSIQAAINASPAGRTITIAPGTYRETLVLKAGVSLTGAGVGQTFVRGDGSRTVITASGNQIQRSTVLQGMTIAGGGGGGPAGMSISSSAAPTLRNLRFSENIVNQGPAGGGLMISGSANPLLENVEIRNNKASAGAGLTLWEGRATLRNCTIVDNISDGPRGVIFGAVYLDDGSELTMENTVISGTTSSSGGGMALLGNSKATITGGRFQGNRASTQGGAIFVRSGSILTLNRVVFIGNASLLDGGAVTVSQATATITDSTFTGNTAQQDAGALNVILKSQITLRDSVVEGNRAERFAGGLTIQDGSQALLERNLIRNNLVTGNDPNPLAGVGGGIKVYGAGANATIRYNRIEGNTARDGGGIYVEFQASAEIRGNEIVANQAREYGGGIVVNDGSSAQIIANVVTDNRSSTDGGGVWINNGSSSRVQDNLIAGNLAVRHGGGLTIFKDLHTEALDNLIVGNSAGQDGGGVRMVTSAAKLAGNRIRNNRAGGDGGGMFIYGQPAASPQLLNNLVTDNSAGRYGAGIFISAANAALTNNSIVYNGRGQSGAGIFLAAGAAPALTNNIIAFNDYGIHSSGGAPTSSARNDVYDNPRGNYSSVPAGGSDLSVDPLFVEGFYLSHSAAGQSRNSPLIDSGQGTASSVGLNNRTTRTDSVRDQSTVDLGYHYALPLRPAPNRPTVFIPLLILGK